MNRQIIDRLLSCEGQIVVACHRTPDGDTLGAGLAVFLWLKGRGKRVSIYCADAVPGAYRFLPCSTDVSSALGEPPEIFVAVDCASADRLGDGGAELLSKAAATINIDHHFTNTNYCQINHVDGKAGSTAEIIAEMLFDAGQEVIADIANCLYTGIVTDTGQFAFDYTRPESLRIAARLMECGAAFEDICARVFRRRTLTKTKLIALALSGLRLYGDGRVAVASVSQAVLKETNASPDECESIVNYTVEIEGVEVGLLLRETQTGDWKVSLRASGGVDVSRIAQGFGGGGHVKASGCTLSGTLEEAERIIVDAALAAILLL